MNQQGAQGRPGDPAWMDEDTGAQPTLGEVLRPLRQNVGWIVGGSLFIGAVALGISFLIKPTFTASTVFIPPQQSQTSVASAISALGPLASLAGMSAGVKSAVDQYASLLRSVTVSDRIIDQFKLMDVYEAPLRFDARRVLSKNVRINIGKKDGLMSVEVDDHDPQRAADMANRYVDELRRLVGALALTEAQQRRVFFEDQLKQSRDRLTKAQVALQSSGIAAGALKAEPKAAAEGFARLKAEATAAEVKLQAMRKTLTDSAPEVQQHLAALTALRAQLGKLEESTAANSDAPDYIGAYREFKYQETLFELFARQYEMARLDESREGALIQVIDPATRPERKSKPKRLLLAMQATGVGAVLIGAIILVLHSRRKRSSRHG